MERFNGMARAPIHSPKRTRAATQQTNMSSSAESGSRGAMHRAMFSTTSRISSSRVIVQAGQTLPCYDADFYPYGGERTYTNTCPQNYKFTGKERDTETGLDNFGARYDSSSLGRFMSPDWSSAPLPVPFSDLADPQSLNLYSYVANNPLNRTDPYGHCWNWIQRLCNGIQEAYYGVFTDYGFRTNKQVTEIRNRETAARRQWLINNNVVTPDKNGNTIDWSTTSSKQVNSGFESATETLAMGAFVFTYLHDKESILKNPELENIRKMSTQDIIKSLNDIGSKGGDWMKIRPDGTVLDGNTRLLVLEERGLDINNLGLRPEVLIKQGMLDEELLRPSRPPTEKPPDNE